MGGALIETEARRILNKGQDEAKRKMALRMLRAGKFSNEEIAKYSGLNIAEVERLAGHQMV